MSAAIRSIGSRSPSRIMHVLVRAAVVALGDGQHEGGQDLDTLAPVAADGRDTDVELGGELGAGVAAPKVGQDEQSLTANRQMPPPRAALPPLGGELFGQRARYAWTDRSTAGDASPQSSWRFKNLWREA